MSAELQPVLPPELEEIIFSICLRDDFDNAQTLILVVKRVYQWIIPQVYKVAMFHKDRFPGRPPRFKSGSLIYHGQHVRHIVLYNASDANETGLYDPSEDCLARCPNVTDVALWIGRFGTNTVKNVFNQLLGLRHLTHLSFDFNAFSLMFKEENEHQQKPVFPNVTHLELISMGRWFEAHLIDEPFPALTHVSLENFHNNSSIVPEICRSERLNKRLKVIIWFLGHTGSEGRLPEVVPAQYEDVIDDPRMVFLRYGKLYSESWYIGIEGGMGIWRTAEETIKERQRTAL